MQVGDPKKAAILAVVAIVIIGVAAFRAIPHGPTAVPMTETARAEGLAVADQVKQKAEDLPTTLTSEPFAKPAPKSPAADSGAPPSDSAKSAPHAGTSIAPLAPERIEGELPAVPVNVGSTTNPSENTGVNRNVNQETPATATFNGVVQVTRRIAIITVSNKTERAFQCGIGSYVAGYKVTEISDTHVALEKGKKVVVLAVGKSAPL